MSLYPYNNRPVNPFINAGALITTYLIHNKYSDDSVNKVVEKVRALTDNDTIDNDMEIVNTVRSGG